MIIRIKTEHDYHGFVCDCTMKDAIQRYDLFQYEDWDQYLFMMEYVDDKEYMEWRI